MAQPDYKERRSAQRHQIEHSFDLVLPDGSILPVQMKNLSMSGLQFQCEDWVANTIEPRGIHHHASDRIDLKVVSHLESFGKFYAECRVITARRLSQESYLIGLAFTDFQNGSDTRLRSFLNQHDKPA